MHRDESESVSLTRDSQTSSNENSEASTKVSRPKTSTFRKSEKPKSKTSLKRLSLYLLLSCAGAIALAVIGWAIFRTPTKTIFIGESVSIAWAPTMDPSVIRSEITPLMNVISEQIETPVVLSIPKSYADTSKKLLNGDVDFALLPPLLYLRTIERNPKVQPVAMKMYQGSKNADGLLLVASKSNVKKVDGLKGKIFCLTDKNSTTGNFLPRVFFKERGTKLDTFAGKIVWSGDHIQGIRDLLAGKCDAVATYSGALLSASDLGIPVAQVRTLAITGHTPQDVVCAGPDTDPELVEKVKNTLLTLDPKKEWNQEFVGKVEKITGFSALDDEDFTDLRKIIKEKK